MKSGLVRRRNALYPLRSPGHSIPGVRVSDSPVRLNHEVGSRRGLLVGSTNRLGWYWGPFETTQIVPRRVPKKYILESLGAGEKLRIVSGVGTPGSKTRSDNTTKAQEKAIHFAARNLHSKTDKPRPGGSSLRRAAVSPPGKGNTDRLSRGGGKTRAWKMSGGKWWSISRTIFEMLQNAKSKETKNQKLN